VLQRIAQRKASARALPASAAAILKIALVTALFVPLALLAKQHLAGWTLSNVDPQERERQIEWRELQSWCRRFTPPESVFITPFTRSGFRSFSARTPVFDWVDGAAMHWHPAHVGPWLDRFSDTGADLASIARHRAVVFATAQHPLGMPERVDPGSSPLTSAFDRLGEEDFLRLGKKYGARFVVVDGDRRPLAFPLIQEGRYFKLYQLPGR
jgi:hypothetical protein